jgi:uncharacterized phosphosugar-binding protein
MKKKTNSGKKNQASDFAYAPTALEHLNGLMSLNQKAMKTLVDRTVNDVKSGKSVFVFGSGHSSLLPLELFHRAGGSSFIIPVVADFLMPQAGPPVVRVTERTPGLAMTLLRRLQPRKGEMLWIMSQSGINAAGIDVALEAKKMGLYTVAFTSKVHSSAVAARHPSGKRLFEVCDLTIDLGGRVGDACVALNNPKSKTGPVMAGPLSTLGAVFLGHTVVVEACAQLEASGHSCVYTSVNTPEGESRNRAIEEKAALRDPLLR